MECDLLRVQGLLSTRIVMGEIPGTLSALKGYLVSLKPLEVSDLSLLGKSNEVK